MRMTKLFTKSRREKRVKWYKTAQWRWKREVQLAKSGLCQMCLESTPRRLTVGSVVDHINPDFDSFRDFLKGETQTLCFECHSAKTAVIDVPKLIRKEKTTKEVRDV